MKNKSECGSLFKCVFLLIFINDDVGDRLRRSFTTSVEPFLNDGGDAGSEEFDVIIDVAGILIEHGGNVHGGIAFYKDAFEVESKFEIELIEDLVLFYVFKEFQKIEAVLTALDLLREDVEKFIHHPIVDGVKQIVDIDVVGIEGRAVDAGFFTDIGYGYRRDIVSCDDEIEIGLPYGIDAFLVSGVICGIHIINSTVF